MGHFIQLRVYEWRNMQTHKHKNTFIITPTVVASTHLAYAQSTPPDPPSLLPCSPSALICFVPGSRELARKTAFAARLYARVSVCVCVYMCVCACVCVV